MASSTAAWTELGSGVRVRASRLYRMNSVVVAEAGHAAVVDPGILPSELEDLAAATAGIPDVTLVFTHGDWDHVLGRPWWPRAGTVGHDALAAEVARERDRIRAEADRAAAAAGERFPGPFEPFRPRTAISGLHAGRLGSRHAVYRDAPGHSASMLSLHLPELRLLIAGDMLSDIELPALQQPPQVYRRTLEQLLPLAEHDAITTLIPGHGAVARSSAEVRARLRRDLAYLETLERETLDLAAIHGDNVRIAYAAARPAGAPRRPAGGHRRE
jgi:hydroxyacylglutathione hydrolase